MFANKKTFIISIIGGGLAVLELFGIFDFPFIEDPMTMIQVAITAITLRIGIGTPKQD